MMQSSYTDRKLKARKLFSLPPLPPLAALPPPEPALYLVIAFSYRILSSAAIFSYLALSDGEICNGDWSINSEVFLTGHGKDGKALGHRKT